MDKRAKLDLRLTKFVLPADELLSEVVVVPVVWRVLMFHHLHQRAQQGRLRLKLQRRSALHQNNWAQM